MDLGATSPAEASSAPGTEHAPHQPAQYQTAAEPGVAFSPQFTSPSFLGAATRLMLQPPRIEAPRSDVGV